MVSENSSLSPAVDGPLLRIPVERLHPHPANANVMADEVADKVARNIERQGNYPPLLVREHPAIPDDYQILDGEQRWRIVGKAGHSDVLCYLWSCDDATALLLLATINRLRGEDIVGRRGELLAELDRLLPRDVLASLLPENSAEIDEALEFTRLDANKLLQELTDAASRASSAGPRLISFAVIPEDEAIIERAIAIAAQRFDGTNRRGRALGAIAANYIEAHYA